MTCLLPPESAPLVRSLADLQNREPVAALAIGPDLDWGDPPTAHRILRRAHRLLTEGGHLWVAVPARAPACDESGWRPAPVSGRPEGSFAETAAEAAAVAEGGHRWWYSAEELQRVALRAGLRCDEEASAGSIWTRFRRPVRRLSARPLVSVLIPAYKPSYVEAALRSVLSQTWTHLEVLIFDDCPTDEIEQVVARVAGADPRVRYRHNRPGLGGQDNHVALFEACSGELVKFLSDDDVLEPRCIERLMDGLRMAPDATLATSQRTTIDGKGQVLPVIPATAFRSATDTVFCGEDAVEVMLRQRTNFVGEPSTALFRRADLDWVRPHLLSLKGMRVIGNGDVTLWIGLLGQGDLVYVAEPLSCFRLHPGQEQAASECFDRGEAAWRLNREQCLWMGLYSLEVGRFLAPQPFGGEQQRGGAVSPTTMAEAQKGVSSPDASTRRVALEWIAREGSTPELIRAAGAAVKAAPRHPWAYSLLSRAIARSGDAALAARLWTQMCTMLSEQGVRTNLRADPQGKIPLRPGNIVSVFAELGPSRLSVSLLPRTEACQLELLVGDTRHPVAIPARDEAFTLQVVLSPAHGVPSVTFEGNWPDGALWVEKLAVEPVWRN